MAFALALFIGLAVWRVTHMIWAEGGPFDVFARLRAYLAQRQKHTGGLYSMVSCFNCLSVWVSIIPALLAPSIVLFILYTLVFSAIAIFLNQVFYKLK